MNIQTVPARRGIQWISEGFELFRKNPVIWIVTLIIYLTILAVLGLVPIVGLFAPLLLQPVLTGGLMAGCDALYRGEDLHIEHLFDGFQKNTQSLVMTGFYCGLGYLLAALLVGGLSAGILGNVWQNMGSWSNQELNFAFESAPIAVLALFLFASCLMVPVMMAGWFAPVLVMFEGLSAWEAMKASFSGCLKNMWPLTIYSLAIMVLTMLAIIPAGLGLLVLIPVVTGSIYKSYRDIFANNGQSQKLTNLAA